MTDSRSDVYIFVACGNIHLSHEKTLVARSDIWGDKEVIQFRQVNLNVRIRVDAQKVEGTQNPATCEST